MGWSRAARMSWEPPGVPGCIALWQSWAVLEQGPASLPVQGKSLVTPCTCMQMSTQHRALRREKSVGWILGNPDACHECDSGADRNSCVRATS